jgi:sorting nexin-9/18/33
MITTSNVGHKKEDSNESIDEDEADGLNNLSVGEADRHFVEVGPSWRAKLPPFHVLVHSPSKRASALSGAYTAYSVTSLFHKPPSNNGEPESITTRITVQRRFSHFVFLHRVLTRRLPGIALPPLPEKQYAGRFNSEFVEARRGDLERYIGRLVRHPLARYAEVVTFFLSCESERVCRTDVLFFAHLPVSIRSGNEWYPCISPYVHLVPPFMLTFSIRHLILT